MRRFKICLDNNNLKNFKNLRKNQGKNLELINLEFFQLKNLQKEIYSQQLKLNREQKVVKWYLIEIIKFQKLKSIETSENKDSKKRIDEL